MKYLITLTLMLLTMNVNAQLDYNTGLLEIEGKTIDIDKIIIVSSIWVYNAPTGRTYTRHKDKPHFSGNYFNIQFQGLDKLIRYEGVKTRDIIIESWKNWKKHKNILLHADQGGGGKK